MNQNEYANADEVRKAMLKEKRTEEARTQSALDIYEVPTEKGRDKKPIALFCVLLIISLLLLLSLIIVAFVKLSKVTEELRTLHSEHSDSISNVSLELTEVKQTDLSRINEMFAELQETLGSICNTCPYGWKWFNGSCYSFSKAMKNWDAARMSCNDRDSDLVIINNKDEQSFLSTNIGSENYWIGLNDKDKEGDWRWADGSPLSFTFWLNGEPNNDHDEDCGHLTNNANTRAQWNDIKCDTTFRWICEKRTLCNFTVPGSSG